MELIRAWIVRVCLWLLVKLDADPTTDLRAELAAMQERHAREWAAAICPTCANALTKGPVRACAVCGTDVSAKTLRQHDGRYLCAAHKAVAA